MDETEIIKVRVARDQVKHFAFDLVYFVPIQRKDLLPKLFPWSICLPANQEFVRQFFEVKVRFGELMPHETRRESLSVAGRASQLLPADWSTKYFIVVPILPMERPQITVRKKDQPIKAPVKGEKVPGYLTAPQHADTDKSKLDGILDDDTVLFTPKGPVRPICKLCPRHLLHIQNKCELGSKHCFTELVLKRSVNEQLQSDGAQPDSDPS